MKAVFLPIIFAFVMQNITGTVPLQSSDYPGNETDHIALLAIKTRLVDHPNGVLSSWNNSVHHCQWDGVVCGAKHNRVTVLDLSSRGLEGTISPFIGNLSFLRKIYLYNNSLYGQIPRTLGHLHRLHELWLSNNTLTGEIPANISSCVNVRSIDLCYNQLEGKLPAEFRALSKLEELLVCHNNLTGSLFDIIQNLTSLVKITVALNSLTGTIPGSIGRMPHLYFFSAAANGLSGTLPASFFNSSSLQVLEISYNQLHGKLSAQIGITMHSLKQLHIAGNSFAGTIPISINNLTSLESIVLNGNHFIGRVPQGFGHFPNLTNLVIFGNNLEGDINFITNLVNCTQLSILQFGDNDFSGTLPKSVANLSTTLTWLTLGNSMISGTFPAGISNLINLKRLYIYSTRLTASIPHDFGKLDKVESVNLSNNRLVGRIPNSVGNLSRLSMLLLNDNILEGSIPESIGNCRSLLYLNLTNNHFSGNIPSEMFAGSPRFIYIILSRNRLEGSLPFEISKQTGLTDLEVSNNKFSGVIPDGLSECTALQYLYLDGNAFDGQILSSLNTLSSLLQIDVSRNNLSGQIPAYLSTFPLNYLNLSYNDFEGRVPTTGVLANVSSVFLIGNNRLCGGIQALHLPKCDENKTMERKKRKMSDSLKKVIISAVCALVVMVAIAFVLCLIYRRNQRKSTSLVSMTGKTFTKVSYAMLLKATNGFSSDNLLGAGSFGSVFKGNLEGKMVAVKVLNMQHCGASKSFIAECKTLRNVRHRNLVGIITVCSSIDFQRNDFRALIYEFMPNGSLDRWLLGVFGNMSFAQRLDVAIDVAHALNYLHHDCENPIVHCDLKPSNILLDNDMTSHVGDFGLSMFLNQPLHPNQSSTIGVRGTVGYAAPVIGSEYGLGVEASTNGDVYSYGILLLELITGKSPTDNMFKEEYNLHMYAEGALPDQVLEIIDPTLEEDNLTEEADDKRATQNALQRRMECIISVVSVGVLCSNHSPHNRMKITDAISRLQSARDSLLKPRRMRNLPCYEHYEQFTTVIDSGLTSVISTFF